MLHTVYVTERFLGVEVKIQHQLGMNKDECDQTRQKTSNLITPIELPEK